MACFIFSVCLEPLLNAIKRIQGRRYQPVVLVWGPWVVAPITMAATPADPAGSGAPL